MNQRRSEGGDPEAAPNPMRGAPAAPTLQRTPERVLGCLLGGAVADASDGHIGYPTQLTLWTTEGLIRAVCRSQHKGMCHPPGVVYHALLRWLRTQGELSAYLLNWGSLKLPFDGWLIRRRRLFRTTHAGGTVMKSLRAGVQGTRDRRVNDSVGAGALAHMAPCAFLPGEDPMDVAREMAALTHGNPAAHWTAGATAHIVHLLACGMHVEDATRTTLERLACEGASSRVVTRLSEALGRTNDRTPLVHPFSQAQFATAPDALALSVFAARSFDDFTAMVAWIRGVPGVSRVAVSLAGQMMGTYLGFPSIPAASIRSVKTHDIIETLGRDLITLFEPSDEWWARYPGW